MKISDLCKFKNKENGGFSIKKEALAFKELIRGVFSFAFGLALLVVGIVLLIIGLRMIFVA